MDQYVLSNMLLNTWDHVLKHNAYSIFNTTEPNNNNMALETENYILCWHQNFQQSTIQSHKPDE
jgi:hypothetical protein